MTSMAKQTDHISRVPQLLIRYLVTMASLNTNQIKNECQGIARECQTSFHHITTESLILN